MEDPIYYRKDSGAPAVPAGAEKTGTPAVPAVPAVAEKPEKPEKPAGAETPGTPAGAETPAVPAVAEKPGTPAGAETPAVPHLKGLDDTINWLRGEVDAMKEGRMTAEELRKLRKRQAAQKMVASISDMGRALANMYFVHNYAPNAYDADKDSLSERMQRRFDALKAERDANDARLYNYSVRLAELERQRAEMERSDLEAKVKAERAARADEHDAAMWPYLLAKAKGEADYWQARADGEPALAEAKVRKLRAEVEKLHRGSRAGGASGGGTGKRYYGTLDGVAYATKADYEKALDALVDKYEIEPIEVLENVNAAGLRTSRDVLRKPGDLAAEAEAKAAAERERKAAAERGRKSGRASGGGEKPKKKKDAGI